MSFFDRLRTSSLHSIVYKEQRQGLRSRAFVAFFLLLQSALAFSMLLLPLSAEAGTWFFWIVVGAVLLIALPARGLVSVSTEVRAQTLEMLFLTRLSSLRIILGKWLALVLQGLLCAVAILPYLFVRYLMGGLELASELAGLMAVTLLSALLTAITVSFSAFSSWWSRLGLAAAASLLIQLSLQASPIPETTREWVDALGFTVVAAGLLTAILLVFGASRIASPAENQPMRLRLLCLAFCLVIPLIGLATGLSSAAAILVLGTAMGVGLYSLVEEHHPIPGALLPFAKLRGFGRFAAYLFSPGWASGFVYTLLLFILLEGITAAAARPLLGAEPFQAIFVVTCLFASLLVPMALIRALIPAKDGRLLPFVWIQLFMVFLTFLISLIEQVLATTSTGWGPIDLLAFFPTASLLLVLSQNLTPDEIARFFAVNVGLTLLSGTYLLWKAVPLLKEIEEARLHLLSESLAHPQMDDSAQAPLPS